jgi:outer membrane beta-barrel protein
MTRLALGLSVILVSTGLGTTARGQQEAPAATAATPPPAAPLDETAASRAPAGQAAAKKTWDDVVVVPRKAFLKSGRVELAPFTGITLNDVLIRHYTFGGELNYYLTDVFSVGLQGLYFVKELSDREGLVGLQYNRVATLNKFKYAGALNFGYVPGYGKFTLFNKYIWHWDVFVQAGVGLIWTEIIPRDKRFEAFQNMNIMPDFGVGTRFFLNDWMTVSFALRDYIFNDKFEPTIRDATQTIDQVKDAATSKLVNNIMLTVSVGFYLPTSFEYKSPR